MRRCLFPLTGSFVYFLLVLSGKPATVCSWTLLSLLPPQLCPDPAVKIQEALFDMCSEKRKSRCRIKIRINLIKLESRFELSPSCDHTTGACRGLSFVLCSAGFWGGGAPVLRPLGPACLAGLCCLLLSLGAGPGLA